MQTIFISLISYLLGSIPSGKIVGRVQGVDIQKKGSGNIGFANVVRVLGWKSGIIVLFADVLKGFLPTYIASSQLDINGWQLLFVGLMSIVGHAFPIWLKFKGGKSIATGLGVMLAIDYKIALLGILTYTIVFGISRISALGSLAGAWSIAVISLFLNKNIFIFTLLLALFATYTHRKNIRQMLNK